MLNQITNKFKKSGFVLSNIIFSSAKNKIIGEDSKVIPVQICRTGVYAGYRDGEFELTNETFSQIINNFNKEKNPIPLLKGHADVVGSMTGEEAPAAGWILALEQDQNGILWALTELTSEMENLIKQGMYRFTSIFMQGDALDRVTGEPIGARLQSVAATNSPFIDGLQPLSLSNNIISNSLNIYTSKEIQMKAPKKNKSVVLAEPITETLPESEQAAEQMDKIQQGKVVEPSDPMDMLNEAKNLIDPEMSMEDFVKYLITLMSAHEKEEEVLEPQEEMEPGEEAEEVKETVAASEPEVVEEDKEDASKQEQKDSTESESDKKKVMPVAASNTILSATVKSLNLALSSAKKEIDSLKEQLNKEKSIILSAIVEDAVSKGKLLDSEKSAFIKLGNSDRALFDELLTARNHKPQIVLSRLTGPEIKDTETSDINKVKISDNERKMLEGAKVKIKL